MKESRQMRGGKLNADFKKVNEGQRAKNAKEERKKETVIEIV